MVDTNYAYDILDLDHAAKEEGIAIIPGCSLDPRIDLVIYRRGLMHFDEVYKSIPIVGGFRKKQPVITH